MFHVKSKIFSWSESQRHTSNMSNLAYTVSSLLESWNVQIKIHQESCDFQVANAPLAIW